VIGTWVLLMIRAQMERELVGFDEVVSVDSTR